MRRSRTAIPDPAWIASSARLDLIHDGDTQGLNGGLRIHTGYASLTSTERNVLLRRRGVADIFISYSKRDHSYAQELAAFLKDVGYSVWWDTELVPGATFRETILKEIDHARAVIVIWSRSSAKSDFVIDEADIARRDEKLISVRLQTLGANDIPMGFRGAHVEILDHVDKILAALRERGLRESRPVSLYALRAFSDRLKQVGSSRTGRNYVTFGLASVLALVLTVFFIMPGLTIDLPGFYVDQYSSSIKTDNYLRREALGSYNIVVRANMTINRRHRYLNYMVTKDYENQKTRLRLLDSGLQTVFEAAFDAPFFSPNNDGGLINISIPNSAGLENIQYVYLHTCSHFTVDEQPSSVTTLRQINFNSGTEPFQQVIAGAIRAGVVGQIASILTSDLIGGSTREQIEAAFPCIGPH